MKIRIRRERWPIHQVRFWDLPNFIKILVGGYGCGKTYIGSLRAIYLSYLNSGLMGIFVSPTYAIAELTTIPTIKDILARMEVAYKFNQQKHLFWIPSWYGHIKIASGEDPISLKGGNMAWAGIDEPFVQRKEVFNEVDRRIRHPEATQKEIFMTGTPEELNWGYDLCMDDQDLYDVGFVYGRTADNEYIGGEEGDYYKRLYRSYSDDQRKAYLEGKFLNLLQGRVYKEFERDKHMRHVPFHDSFIISAGIDFNVDYMTAVIYYDMNGSIHFFDEIRLTNSNTFDLAERLSRKYPGIEVYPDPSGGARKSSSSKTDHQILRDFGFSVRSRPKVAVRDRVNAVNALLRNDLFSIEPNTCPWLVRDMERNTWKSGDINKDEAELTHAGDAAGYAIEYRYPVLTRGWAQVARA